MTIWAPRSKQPYRLLLAVMLPAPEATQPSQKADINGHAAPADPEVQALAAHRATVAASNAPQKADKNGHRKWAGKGSNHVPFYRGVSGRR